MPSPERTGWLVAVTGDVHLVAPDGRRHPVRGGQCQLVLAALALLRRPVLRDEIADLLWGDTPLPDHWAGAVRGVVSKVRSALVSAGLPPEVLRGDAGAVSLDASIGWTTDLDEAEHAVTDSRSLLASGDAAGALVAVDDIARRLGGPVLAAHDGDVCRTVRERVHRTMAEAERLAVGALIGLGRCDDACARAARAIAHDRLDESMHALLIRAHLAAGRPAAARRVFDELTAVLADEIGVEPAATTRALLVQDVRGRAPSGPADGEMFLGRDAQREIVLRMWGEVREQRRPAVVVVDGPAGIGKTRFVREVVEQLVVGGTELLWGRTHQGSGVPYESFVDALRRRASGDDDLSAALGLELMEVPHLVPELGPVIAGVHRTDDREVARSQFFREVRAIVAGLAGEGLVWVVDDAHWASTDTLTLLRSTLRDLCRPVLLLVAARTVRDALAETLAEVQRDLATVSVALPALAEDELLPLVATLPSAANGSDDEEIAHDLFALTGGHPFFVVELARDARRRGRVDAGRVPEPVRDWVRRRADALPQRLQGCLELCAVIGDEVEVALVGAAAGGASVGAMLDELVAHGFLTAGDEAGRVRFAHQITRDAVRDRLGAARRAECHAAVARVLATDEWAGRDADLAHHAAASGPTGRSVALAASRRAARESLAKHAWQLATDQLRVALELAGDRPAERAQVLVELGIACHRLRRTVEARAMLLDAAALARDHELASVLARAVLELVGRGGRGAAIGMADADREALLRDALHAMHHWPAEPGDGAERELLIVTLEGELSLAMLFTERHAERRALVLDGEARVRSHSPVDPVLLARAVLNARSAKTAPECLAQRLGDLREVLAMPSAVLSADSRVAALTYLHEDLLRTGDRAAARRHLDDARRAADRIGHPFWQWAIATWTSLDLVIAGRLDEAERTLMASMRGGDLEASEAAACLGVQLTDIRLFQGRAVEVLEAIGAAAASNPGIPCYRAVHALVASECGRTTVAEEEYAWFAESGFAALPDDSNRFLGLAVLGDVAADLGDPSGAAVLSELLRPYAEQQVILNCYGGGGAFWGPTSRILGRLARVAGDDAAAAGWFSAAAASATAFGAPLAAARIERESGCAPHHSTRRPSTSSSALTTPVGSNPSRS